MSWTVACFCGTVFEAPPDRCPTCASRLPDAHRSGRVDNEPQRPDDTLLGDVDAELSALISSARSGQPASSSSPAHSTR